MRIWRRRRCTWIRVVVIWYELTCLHVYHSPGMVKEEIRLVRIYVVGPPESG